MLKHLAADGEISVLLIEQNLGVAIDVADTVDVMVNGRIARSMPSAELAADRDLQQRLLGVTAAATPRTRRAEAPRAPAAAAGAGGGAGRTRCAAPPTTRRRADRAPGAPAERAVRGFTRWNAADPLARAARPPARRPGRARQRRRRPSRDAAAALAAGGRDARVIEFPVAATIGRAAYVAGTFDTKGRELFFLRNCLEKLGLRTVTVDLATSGKPSPAMISPREVARHHPKGERAVFTGDRGTRGERDGGGLRALRRARAATSAASSRAGGSGGTALATPRHAAPAHRRSQADGVVGRVRGRQALCRALRHLHDVLGHRRGRHQPHLGARARQCRPRARRHDRLRPRRRRAVRRQARDRPHHVRRHHAVRAGGDQARSRSEYDCLVFHATGTGGQSMEKLVDSGLLAGVIDVTTTEVADEVVGGVLAGGPDRLDAIVRTRLPYVGSCGALDMVNFWAMDTVPAQFRGRNLYRHNANVTLMRTTPEECARIGGFIADEAQPHGGPGALPHPRGWRLAHRCARASPSRIPPPTGRSSTPSHAVPRDAAAAARPAAPQRQRPGVRGGPGRGLPRDHGRRPRPPPPEPRARLTWPRIARNDRSSSASAA